MALTKWQERALRRLRRRLELRDEDASFDQIGPDPGSPLPQCEEQVTAFIRERTRVWRDSWVLPLIDQVLAGRDPGHDL